jgi:hypothetical protein
MIFHIKHILTSKIILRVVILTILIFTAETATLPLLLKRFLRNKVMNSTAEMVLEKEGDEYFFF